MSWQMEYTVDLLTWNVDGKGSQGHAERRDVIVSHVYHQLQPDIGFLQEVPVREDKETRRSSNWYLAGSQHHSSHYIQHIQKTHGVYQGAVVSNPNTCNELERVSLEGLIPEYEEPTVPDYLALSDYSLRRIRSDIPPRVLAAKLVKKGMPFPQIVVTFHSIYKEKVEIKRQYIIDFFNLMCRLADREGCPVLIGADFNLHVGHWEHDVRQLFNGPSIKRPLRERVQFIPTREGCPVLIGADFNLPVGDMEPDVKRLFNGRDPSNERPRVQYKPTFRRARKDLLDTFAVVLPDNTYNPYGHVRLTYTCTFGEPKAYYPFPKEHSGNGDNTLEYTESEKAKLPNDKEILEDDFDHDPVVVRLKIRTNGEFLLLFLFCFQYRMIFNCSC